MKITIVGTGTASWLSAFVLSHTTNHDITVIEAFNLPTRLIDISCHNNDDNNSIIWI